MPFQLSDLASPRRNGGRLYQAEDENRAWHDLLPLLGVTCIRHSPRSNFWLQPPNNFDVLLGALPFDTGTHVLAYLNDRDRNQIMWVNWNMRAFVWERVPNNWHPPITEVRYNPRVILGRSLLDRVWEINAAETPPSVRGRVLNDDGFRVGQTVKIIIDNSLPTHYFSRNQRYEPSENVGKLAIIVRVTRCYVFIVRGSLWPMITHLGYWVSTDLNIKKMLNSHVALSRGIPNEVSGRRL